MTEIASKYELERMFKILGNKTYPISRYKLYQKFEDDMDRGDFDIAVDLLISLRFYQEVDGFIHRCADNGIR